MGLLDDAIREHLELKRLRGADPGLVSREESEVFGPVRGGDLADHNGEIAVPGPPDHGDAPSTGHDLAQTEGFQNVGHETAELDMRTVLESESEAGRDVTPAEPVAVAPVAAAPRSSDTSQEPGATDDPLEWEMPEKNTVGGSGEHIEGDRPSDQSGDEPVEDVLEETPDFLRDTPEQERLWFEQRPPRDFDFDK
jgi:hypothetical protein